MQPPTPDGLVDRLRSLPVGTRVSIRRRLGQGWTDALGELTAVDEVGCEVTTRRGPVRIEWVDVVAGKPVPPPPPRRAPRRL